MKYSNVEWKRVPQFCGRGNQKKGILMLEGG